MGMSRVREPASQGLCVPERARAVGGDGQMGGWTHGQKS